MSDISEDEFCGEEILQELAKLSDEETKKKIDERLCFRTSMPGPLRHEDREPLKYWFARAKDSSLGLEERQEAADLLYRLGLVGPNQNDGGKFRFELLAYFRMRMAGRPTDEDVCSAWEKHDLRTEPGQDGSEKITDLPTLWGASASFLPDYLTFETRTRTCVSLDESRDLLQQVIAGEYERAGLMSEKAAAQMRGSKEAEELLYKIFIWEADNSSPIALEFLNQSVNSNSGTTLTAGTSE